MRVALFDWTEGGHHPLYLERFAEALRDTVDVVIAAPDDTVARLSHLDVELHALGSARPREDFRKPLRPQQRVLTETEIALCRSVAEHARVDHLVHLYGDQILRGLARTPAFAVPVSLVIFYPSFHYPRIYRSSLSLHQRLRGAFLELLIHRWRHRPDAHAIMALDPAAAQRWRAQNGATASWLPEPPVKLPSQPLRRRSGCVMYGTFSRHKGAERLADAVIGSGIKTTITLAGQVQPEFEGDLRAIVARMQRSQVDLDLRLRGHSEAEGLAVLAGARCAVLPYARHIGMSRVLLEAAAAGTPVIAEDYGLLGQLVREHELGFAVDSGIPHELGTAIARLTENPEAQSIYGNALAAFADRHSHARFRDSLIASLMI